MKTVTVTCDICAKPVTEDDMQPVKVVTRSPYKRLQIEFLVSLLPVQFDMNTAREWKLSEDEMSNAHICTDCVCEAAAKRVKEKPKARKK
ncbi:hypothetical protein CfE428DRAFT_4200 [Chthoniobacter flavus Ellin428]|uniref:Uncharacterized protein n=1 Tax=Chthoniobacter flavus Ellin428 TaxID=497964 RepID=B4D5L1_9BACT|nr:hypothetical protein [Chthoniobacter flavus]EDY18416.1 hypothetical protein CfE428DRAFT_4200 [Chthoniobacter flavus Ellin428]TCO90875.1 hypothetical protein EV701_10924 [Chthoniobacter flavus]